MKNKFKVYSYQLTDCVSQFYLDQSKVIILRIPSYFSPYGWLAPPKRPQRCPTRVACRDPQYNWEKIQKSSQRVRAGQVEGEPSKAIARVMPIKKFKYKVVLIPKTICLKYRD